MKIMKKQASIIIYALIIIFIVIGTIFRCIDIHAEDTGIVKENDCICVPVIMYHSVLNDKSMRGEYVVTPEEVESDIKYLKENGYEAVFINDLINYVNGIAGLPEKPVVLTFDDGFYNNYPYLLPLLQKYDFRASISIVGEYTTEASESAHQPDPSYSYLRWCDINDMLNSGYFEICNHTNAMHQLSPRKGVLKNSGETVESYREAFLKDVLSLQSMFEDNCGFKPNVFTYPYGFYDLDSKLLVRECGFEASFGVEEKINIIKIGSPECLFEMGRFNRPGNITTEEFMSKVFGWEKKS